MTKTYNSVFLRITCHIFSAGNTMHPCTSSPSLKIDIHIKEHHGGKTYLINGNYSNITSFSQIMKLIAKCVKEILVLKVAILNPEWRGH